MKATVLAVFLVTLCGANPIDVDVETSERFSKVEPEESRGTVSKSSSIIIGGSEAADEVVRMSKKCIHDITASSQYKYKTCTAIFEEIFAEGALFTDNKVTEFCSTEYDCPAYMVNLNKRLIEDCKISANNLDSTTEEFMSQACAYGPEGKRCMSLWHSAYLLLAQNGTESATSYNECLRQVHESNVETYACPEDCKVAESWVQTLVGCCYHSLMDYITTNGDSSLILPEAYWKSCGVSVPEACPRSNDEI